MFVPIIQETNHRFGVVIPAPDGKGPDEILVNWITTEERSLEKRYHRGKLAICVNELVSGGFYSAELLPVVEILVDEDPLAPRRSELSFSIGDRVLVDPKILNKEALQPVSTNLLF